MISIFMAFIIPVLNLDTFSSNAAKNNIDYTLWDKFLKYDLCITDYDSLTEEEKELCHFIFETEQGTDETIICERARRTLAHDDNIGERVTLEQLEGAYGIWDNYSPFKYGEQGYIHCVPDIKQLDGWSAYNEYWLDDNGDMTVKFTGENYSTNEGEFKVSGYFDEEDLDVYSDIEADYFAKQNNGRYKISFTLPIRKMPKFKYEIRDDNEYFVSDEYIERDGDYYFILSDNTAVFVKSKYSTRSLRGNPEPITESFVVPDEIDGYPVVAIEAGAFQFAPVTKVVLPKTIKFIDSWAFDGCIHLDEITLPERLEYIGIYAFSGTALEKIELNYPNISILPNTFDGCDKLTDATLNVKSIDTMAFFNCESLRNIAFGDSVEKISSQAFMNCGAIENINFPASLKAIGTGAFKAFYNFGTGIKSITIPPTVEIIGALPRQHGIGATSGMDIPASHPLTDESECAFDPDCTINGWYGTEAHSYALSNNLKFNPMDELLYGDANGDNEIGVADAVALQKYLLRNETVGYEADLNKDGRIDSFDMIAMRKMLVEN